ncbi:MAG: ABC transporter substrate-binding protein [Acidimicrobiales bacterium]
MVRLRPLLAPLVASCLIAAACGDDAVETSPATSTTDAVTTSSTGDDATTTTQPVELTASFRGVTPETIKVGVLAYDWDRLAALGVEFGVSNNGDLGIAALEAINDRGGIHGRMLEPVLTEFLPVGSTEADAACVKLTEDEEVFVVVGIALNEQILCFTDIHETAAIVAGGMNDERLGKARAPYISLVDDQAGRADAFVDIMRQAGVLEGQRVGVIGSIDVSESAFRSMVDAFRAAGFDPVEGLIGGNADDLAESAREQALIYQRMQDEGVTVAVSTTGVPLEIANAFDADYEPDQWLLLTSMSGRGLTDAGVPHEYLDGALAVVNTPTGTSAQPSIGDDPLIAACVDDLRARTDHPLPYSLEPPVNNIATALVSCSIATILEAGLTNAGPELTNESFQAGLEAIGPIDLPGYFDATIGPGDYGAAKGLTLVRFDAATGVWMPVDPG